MFDFQPFNFDTDGDGFADSFATQADMDGDGFFDSLLIDTDSDGDFDVIAIDDDYDGDMETIMSDVNNDGTMDTFIYEADTDGNGYADSVVYEADTDGDGVVDTLAFGVDTDGDGYVDAYQPLEDSQIASDTAYMDADGDGIEDTLVISSDTDGDGIIDAVDYFVDSDGDGFFDSAMSEVLVDTDGDGVEDTYVFAYDQDGDGEFELVDIYDYDEQSGMIQPVDYVPGEGSSPEMDTFDATQSNPDEIYGDPEESMEHWEYQGDTNRCAIYSQLFVIEELTGQELDIEELADIAEENDWFTEENGTPIAYMNKLLDYYGVENEMTFDNDLEDLQESLEAGEKVIVSLDADEVWYGDDDTIYAPDDGVNHAVQVIGIDYSNPDEPMVILNDSGNPDGCGEMVPLDTFMDAWEDGNCQMITCM